MSNNESVVILGGGIIGLSIAFYLSQTPNYNRPIYIVDTADELLESASGYAGGFLARDWFPEPAAALGDLSFKLHRQLANSYNGQRRWGYAGSHVYSLTLDDAPAGVRGEDWLLAGTSRAQSAGRRSYGHVSSPGENVNEDGTPAWMTPQVGSSWNVVASADDCAQVEPRKLCEFLLSKCQQNGVRLHLGTRATRIVEIAAGKASTLRLEATTGRAKPTFLQCSDVVIAAGCWTPRVLETLFPKSRVKLGIDALAGHSVLYRTPRYTKPFLNIAHGKEGEAHSKDEHIAYAIYCPPTKNWSYSPEAYARLNADGQPEIWIGGLNNNSNELPLPMLATETKDLINKDRIAELRQAAVQLTGLKGSSNKAAEDDLEIISEALCFRPVRKQGVPIIGEVPSRDMFAGSHATHGAKIWIASGHGPWGISLSLGTGVVMCDMLSGREPRVDISKLKVEPTISSKL